ncbi:translation initiation factor IF-2-like [Neomonachus schauinslandi]|uniref:Translation initiation factor IF-2-like n=1 Tax=Neomonachus schauinslandi TaxID=29088 RepID=A0A2Y9G3R8_NEOSC|nr:translation initiation factor IF-2-like [Neomonachus schauinslandi]
MASPRSPAHASILSGARRGGAQERRLRCGRPGRLRAQRAETPRPPQVQAPQAPPRPPPQPTAGGGGGAWTRHTWGGRPAVSQPRCPQPAARRSSPPPRPTRVPGPCLPRDRCEARPAHPAGVVPSVPPPRRPSRFHNGSASTVGRLAVRPLAHPPLLETGPASRPPSTQPRCQGGPARRPALPAAGGSLPVRAREPPPRPPTRVASLLSATAAALQAADGGREAPAQSAPRAFGIASNQRSSQSRLRPSCSPATQGSPEAEARGAAVGAARGRAG